MELSELNPHIRYARIHRAAFGIEKSISVCYDCRAFFFDHIQGSIEIAGREYDISNKMTVFLPPETHYRFRMHFREDSTCIVLNFDLTGQNRHLDQPLGTAREENFDPGLVPSYNPPEELLQPILQVTPALEHTLTQCADHFLQQVPLYREKASALLKLVLLELIHQNNRSRGSALCEAVMQFVREHYTEHSLTNREIADIFHYHPDYISALLRNETGRTLQQLLIHYRLRMAKNLLITTQYDISEIAWRCGFCSASYFIKQFRQNTGMTPRTYRSQKLHTDL